MQELTEKQLFQALQHAKSLDEQAGRAILQRFQTQQPALAQTLFGVFSSVMAEQDQNLSHLFMDLCFDVIAVFEQAFGDIPDHRQIGNGWFEDIAALLDQEMDTTTGQTSSKSPPHPLNQEHQKGLVSFLHAAIDQETSTSPSAIRLTKTMIFTTVQLFNALYDAAAARQNPSIH